MGELICELMPHQFVQDKFIQEFVTISSLKRKIEELICERDFTIRLRKLTIVRHA